jgi:hypothetical protein
MEQSLNQLEELHQAKVIDQQQYQACYEPLAVGVLIQRWANDPQTLVANGLETRSEKGSGQMLHFVSTCLRRELQDSTATWGKSIDAYREALLRPVPKEMGYEFDEGLKAILDGQNEPGSWQLRFESSAASSWGAWGFHALSSALNTFSELRDTLHHLYVAARSNQGTFNVMSKCIRPELAQACEADFARQLALNAQGQPCIESGGYTLGVDLSAAQKDLVIGGDADTTRIQYAYRVPITHFHDKASELPIPVGADARYPSFVQFTRTINLSGPHGDLSHEVPADSLHVVLNFQLQGTQAAQDVAAAPQPLVDQGLSGAERVMGQDLGDVDIPDVPGFSGAVGSSVSGTHQQVSEAAAPQVLPATQDLAEATIPDVFGSTQDRGQNTWWSWLTGR